MERGAAQPQTQGRHRLPAGPSEQRAPTQPDPPAGRGSPKTKKPFPKKEELYKVSILLALN